MWVEVLLALVSVATAAYLYIKRRIGWFKSHGICEHDFSFPGGCTEVNSAFAGKMSFIRVTSAIYEKQKDKKMVGLHGMLGLDRSIILIDLDLIKQIFVKDFDYFTNKEKMDFGNKYINSALFALEGETWRRARHASTPVFTSGKLRKMSRLMKKVAHDLVAQLDKFASTGEDVDACDLSLKFTVTVIANAGFGIDANAFEPQGEKFYKMARKIAGTDRTVWDIFKIIGSFLLAKLLPKMKMSFLDTDTVNFFNDIIDQRLKMRNTEAAKRNDMVDLFTETMMGNVAENEYKSEVSQDLEGSELSKPKKFTEEEMDCILRGNLFAMFFAGMELPANMMSGCIFFLAKNQDIQERLFQEVTEANLDEQLEYDTIMKLPYLDMVVREAMRHNGSVDPNLVCSRDYAVPGTDITIPKGTRVLFSTYGISMDDRYFPNPTEFNPEHFNPTNKEKRSSTTDVVFSLGPRQCIGNRFAILQFKTGIANMVNKFRILPATRLPEKYEVDPKAGSLKIKGGIWVKFERRE